MNRFSIIDAEQRSVAWCAARIGRATGSKADAILAKVKSGEAATRRNYKIQLVTERLTGKTQESDFLSKPMQAGIEKEPLARAAYEARTGMLVRETGFLSMTEFMAGCSLDGDVEEFKGLVSFKAPLPATHVKYLKEVRLPPEYVPQATHEMWCTGAEWYEFVSYCDVLPENLQLLIVRVERNEFQVAQYEAEIRKFLAEVELEYRELKAMNFRAMRAA